MINLKTEESRESLAEKQHAREKEARKKKTKKKKKKACKRERGKEKKKEKKEEDESMQGRKREWEYNKIQFFALTFLLQCTIIDGCALQQEA